MLGMHRALLQTGHEKKDQGGDEVCRPPHALSASGLVRCALPDREITYARPSKIAKQLSRPRFVHYFTITAISSCIIELNSER